MVTVTGTYDIGHIESATTIVDTMLFLYGPGGFDPASPLLNGVDSDDDDGPGFLSYMATNLNAGTMYTLVTTTFDNGVTGDWGVYVRGPGDVVPEPASMAALGLGALALLRRRKK
jgi:hypothetical protein